MQIHVNSKMADQLGLPRTGKAIELYEVSLVSEQQVAATEDGQAEALLDQIAALQAERAKLSDEVLRLAGELESAKTPAPATEDKQPEAEPKKRGK